MTAIQRMLFCFTSMVTASEALELAGIKNMYLHIAAVVIVICTFYLPPLRARSKTQGDSRSPR